MRSRLQHQKRIMQAIHHPNQLYQPKTDQLLTIDGQFLVPPVTSSKMGVA